MKNNEELKRECKRRSEEVQVSPTLPPSIYSQSHANPANAYVTRSTHKQTSGGHANLFVQTWHDLSAQTRPNLSVQKWRVSIPLSLPWPNSLSPTLKWCRDDLTHFPSLSNLFSLTPSPFLNPFPLLSKSRKTLIRVFVCMFTLPNYAIKPLPFKVQQFNYLD